MNYMKLKEQVDRAEWAERKARELESKRDKFNAIDGPLSTMEVNIKLSFNYQHDIDFDTGFLPASNVSYPLRELISRLLDYYKGVQSATEHGIKGGLYDR